MKTRKKITLKKIAVLSLMSASILYAFTDHHFTFIDNKPKTDINSSYETMSTAQLQTEVERQSINGDLPFEMGLELIKRWTNKQ